MQSFPDGVFFVSLAPLEDPDIIASAIAQALGYVEAKNISTIEQLKEGIGNKNLLLVLDNCEHLVDMVARLASDLLSACAQLKNIATSRESLRIPGEWLYAVPAFDLPTESASLDVESASKYPALTLFAERARAVRSDFSLNADNIETIAAICARLDGLPLGIELIAARMRLMSPQALLERLNDQFILSADGMRTASVRQKTLKNTIDWSYGLLSSAEQKLFACLSVFSGGFTLNMAETIFSRTVTGNSVLDFITSLLDKSLLQLAFDEGGKPRYTMLVTIQEYARKRLREMGDETEVRNWHLAYFLDLAERGDKELRGPNQIGWLHWFANMRDNLRVALEGAIESRQTELALRLVRKLDWFWFVRSDHTEAQQWLKRVLAMSEAQLYPGAHAEALTQLAHHVWLQTGPNEARYPVEKALTIARTHNDKKNIAKGLAVLGLILTDERQFAEAQTTLAASKALFQEVDDHWGYAHAVMCLTLPPYRQDDRVTALALYEQTRVLFHELGDSYFEGVALRFIGLLHIKQDEIAQGVIRVKEALTLSRRINSKYEIAVELEILGIAAQAEGNFARALRLYYSAKIILDSIGAWKQANEADFDNRLAACRAGLNESDFTEAVKQGRIMTMEQAIEYALE